MKRDSSRKLEEEREYEAMVLKTARLHELRFGLSPKAAQASSFEQPLPTYQCPRRTPLLRDLNVTLQWSVRAKQAGS